MNLAAIILLAFLMITSINQNQENYLLNSSIMETKNKWLIVNDGVMGGLSSSKVNIKEDKIIFSGNISLENNGGFASLRSPIKNHNFENFYGIEIRIMGDGKCYSISMKETTYFSGYFYTSTFETKKDKWIKIKIPFDQFKLNYFGKETKSNKNIPLNNIKEISLLIGDKQEGNFTAEIDYVKLY